MKVIKDYTDFTSEKGGRFQLYTVSLTASWQDKKPADKFAEVLEEIKKQLEDVYKNNTKNIHLEFGSKKLD